VAVLLSDSPFESVSLLFRRRVEPLIVALKLPLPCPVLALNSFCFSSSIQNKFCMNCSLQQHGSDTLTTWMHPKHILAEERNETVDGRDSSPK
jgi:hypothetical protein